MSIESTYAAALYEAAVEQEAVPAVAADIAAFRQTLAESPELVAALSNPEFDTAAKKAVVGQVAGSAHPLVANFLQVLLDRGRIGDFDAVGRAFAARVDDAENRFEVRAITAVPLTDDLRAKLAERIKETTGRTATIVEQVDPDIIGGLVIEAGEVRVDASLRARLGGLRRRLTKAAVPVAAGAGDPA